MSIASTIAVSGFSVASLRLQVAASNIAKASSDGPLPGTPNPEFPSGLFGHAGQSGGYGGTSATVTNVLPPTIATYDPTARYADGRGMAASPNVDLANELVQVLVAPVRLRRQRAGHPRRRADERRAVQHHCVNKILPGY